MVSGRRIGGPPMVGRPSSHRTVLDLTVPILVHQLDHLINFLFCNLSDGANVKYWKILIFSTLPRRWASTNFSSSAVILSSLFHCICWTQGMSPSDRSQCPRHWPFRTKSAKSFVVLPASIYWSVGPGNDGLAVTSHQLLDVLHASVCH